MAILNDENVLRSDLRLIRRAIRQRWIPATARADLQEEIANIVKNKQAQPLHRVRAFESLAVADRVALEDIRLLLDEERVDRSAPPDNARLAAAIMLPPNNRGPASQ